MELEHFRPFAEMPRERRCVPGVAALDYHGVLKELASLAEAVRQVRYREAVVTDQATQLVFLDHRTALER